MHLHRRARANFALVLVLSYESMEEVGECCRHIQKCRVLAFVLDLCPQDGGRRMPAREVLLPAPDAADAAAQQLQVLVAELNEFDPQLLKKPSVIVLNKSDSTADCGLALTEFTGRGAVADSLAMLPVGTQVMLTSATRKHGVDKLQSAFDRMCLDELHSVARRATVSSHA